MTLHGLSAMAKATDWELVFLAAGCNARLLEGLAPIAEAHDTVSVIELDHAFHRLQGILNHVQHGRIRALAGQLRSLQPDLALIIQGDIEISSLGLLAAKQAGIRAVSYIPLPHNQVEKGAKLGAIRDLFGKGLYKVPDGYITISTVLAEMLREKGATARIEVVYNGIDTTGFDPRDKEASRSELRLPPAVPIVGIAGRLERKQKQQHLLIEALATAEGGCHAAFCGDGPDAAFFRGLVEKQNLQGRVHFLPWSNDLAPFYSAIDALAIPSRYEGVPLVMLEALCCGTPVIAGDRDGMKELLPSQWLFRPGSPQRFREAIETILGDPEAASDKANKLRKKVHETMTLNAFSPAFTAAVREFLPGNASQS